jgi:tetratricopeptide (TPR) repeat protein
MTPRPDLMLGGRGSPASQNADGAIPHASSAASQARAIAQIFQAANILQERGQWPQAEPCYRAILAVMPDHFGALCGLAKICGQRGERAAAVALQGRAGQHPDATAKLRVGAMLSALDCADLAIPLYEQVLAHAPDHADAHQGLADALVRGQRPEAAIRHYERALAIDPMRAAVHHNSAVALERLGRGEPAISHYQRALAIDPELAEARVGLGNALRRLGRLEEAAGEYRKVLAIRPEFAEVHNNLAGVLATLGRAAEAVTHAESALAIRPDDPEAQFNLAIAYEALDRPQDAVVHYRRAVTLRPDFAAAHNNLGNALCKLGQSREAIAHYERALTLAPTFVQARWNLGNALQALGRHDGAAIQYQAVVAAAPDFAEARNNLAAACQKLGRLDEAIGHYQRALNLSPRFVEALNNLGHAQAARGRPEDALALYERACAIKPDLAETHYNRGAALEAMGQFEEAGRAYERAIELAPQRADFHLALVQTKPMTAGDKRLDALLALYAGASMTAEQEVAGHFALARAYADLGQLRLSFAHLREGNRRKRQITAYDEAATLGLFEDIQSVFTPALMAAKSAAGDPSSVPVFVVGMPRSGTTLIEQFLASHSRVFGAGERDDFETATSKLIGANGDLFPNAVRAMSGGDLRQLGSDYLARLRKAAPQAERIVDKMPSNFRLAGLIHLALPQARIIHVHRDPVDTCFSCFSLLFAGEQPYTYDLGELGRYYRAYATLMAHWQTVLPPGVMLDVRYEDVVDDLEAQARRILAHCGLRWDAACLSFHRTQRPVATASARQVRQPIYGSAVGRWRPYAEELGPLLAALPIATAPSEGP